MQRVECPSCGAEVSFRSSASVMAVCEYCRSTLLKEVSAVRDIGKMSSVLEDYSPLQLQTSGHYEGHGFTVIGRIQLRYDAGLWNEWYLLFDDGGDGWLADAAGQYMLTRRVTPPGALPRFERLRAGARLQIEGSGYVASDVRTAECTGGQGELPFAVGKGWSARLVDLRCEERFATLDYSDGEPPACYLGRGLLLAELNPQLLRTEDEIQRSAHAYRGAAVALHCPNCGSALQHRAGITTFAICNSCRRQIDFRDLRHVEVLEKHEQLAQRTTSLTPSDVGLIDGASYSVLGTLCCTDSDDESPSVWNEYLLFSETAGLLWLIETDDGWQRSSVLDRWPALMEDGEPMFSDRPVRKQFEYISEVLHAAGTFTWRVKIGDKTAVTEYALGSRRLVRERTVDEWVWSLASSVSAQQIAGWFPGANFLERPPGTQTGTERASDLRYCKQIAVWATFLLWAFHIPACLAYSFSPASPLIASLLLWLPVYLLPRLTDQE